MERLWKQLRLCNNLYSEWKVLLLYVPFTSKYFLNGIYMSCLIVIGRIVFAIGLTWIKENMLFWSHPWIFVSSQNGPQVWIYDFWQLWWMRHNWGSWLIKFGRPKPTITLLMLSISLAEPSTTKWKFNPIRHYDLMEEL